MRRTPAAGVLICAWRVVHSYQKKSVPVPPDYYTSLPPFQALFETGRPCLTYHKLGPRPRGVRLKGLYLGKRLFERQLSELHRAGFQSASPEKLAGGDGNPDKSIALTFDDGFANVLRHRFGAAGEHGFRAIEYLVVDRLGGFNEWEVEEGEVREALMDVAEVKDWLAAGHEIGSHTLTHPHLSRIAPGRAREEILRAKRNWRTCLA